MKRVVLLALTAMFIISLTACQQKSNNNDEDSDITILNNLDEVEIEDVDEMVEGVPYYDEDTNEIYLDGLIYQYKNDKELILTNYFDEYYTEFVIPETITLEDTTYTVTEIGEEALFYYADLKEVKLPESIIEIGKGAFYGCFDLEKIKLPSGLKKIGNAAFYGCSLKEIILPDGITSIGDEAFCQCESLTEITIPNSVVSIGIDAFFQCISLKKVILGDSLSRISNGMFSGCESLEELNIPSQVVIIGNEAFWDCGMLKELVLPAGLIELGEDALYYCGITSINIPANITIDDEWIFSTCENLQVVYVTKDMFSFYQELFAGADFVVEEMK